MQKYILQITLLSVLAMSSSGFLSAMDPADAGDPAKQPQPNVDTALNLGATGVGLDGSTITASAGTTTTTTTTTTAITSTSTPSEIISAKTPVIIEYKEDEADGEYENDGSNIVGNQKSFFDHSKEERNELMWHKKIEIVRLNANAYNTGEQAALQNAINEAKRLELEERKNLNKDLKETTATDLITKKINVATNEPKSNNFKISELFTRANANALCWAAAVINKFELISGGLISLIPAQAAFFGSIIPYAWVPAVAMTTLKVGYDARKNADVTSWGDYIKEINDKLKTDATGKTLTRSQSVISWMCRDKKMGIAQNASVGFRYTLGALQAIKDTGVDMSVRGAIAIGAIASFAGLRADHEVAALQNA